MKILQEQLHLVKDGAEYIVINTEGTKLANQTANQVSRITIMRYSPTLPFNYVLLLFTV